MNSNEGDRVVVVLWLIMAVLIFGGGFVGSDDATVEDRKQVSTPKEVDSCDISEPSEKQ